LLTIYKNQIKDYLNEFSIEELSNFLKPIYGKYYN
jgi:hypothetical protein